MKHRDINPDEAIDRLLTGLRDVKPPLGMEDRILNAASDRAETRRGRSPLSLLVPARPWMLTAASIAIGAVAIGWVTLRNGQQGHQSASIRREEAPVATPPQQAGLAQFRPLRPVPVMHAALANSERKRAEPKEDLNAEDAQALSDLHAPSQPAPPMALTEQEKFLVEMIHRRDSVELAMLDPEFRSSEEAHSRADFERFFTPPLPPKSPSPDNKSAPPDTQSTTGEAK